MAYLQHQNHKRSNAQFKTAAERAKHWHAIKTFEQKFFAARAPNPDLPPWGVHPRAGAHWSPEENLALFENFKDQVREDAKALGFKELCEIAYLHGRTATSIELQLKKILGFPKFYLHFQLQ